MLGGDPESKVSRAHAKELLADAGFAQVPLLHNLLTKQRDVDAHLNHSSPKSLGMLPLPFTVWKCRKLNSSGIGRTPLRHGVPVGE